MGEQLACPECGKEIETAEHLEEGHEVAEMETESDGSIHLFENRDLYLCKNCKNPVGLFRS